MADQAQKTSNQLVEEKPSLVDVYCVPRAVELADPATDGCGYRGKVQATIQTVANTMQGALIPNYVNQYLVYDNDADLMCPECGHELTPETSKSARTERKRNLKQVSDEVRS
jgi:hypothetical protein